LSSNCSNGRSLNTLKNPMPRPWQMLAQALAKIAHRLLVGLEPEFAKRHLLQRARF
jgi:hypothetical protein